MQAEKGEKVLHRIPISPKLICQPKEDPLYTKDSFLKKYPKYFSQATFNCKSLKNGRFFSRAKRVKTVHSLVLAVHKPYQFWRVGNQPFPKSLARCILNVYKQSIKNLKTGDVARGIYSEKGCPGKIVRYAPGIEKYKLDTSDPDSWRNYFFLQKVKELELVLGSMDKVEGVDKKQSRLVRHLLEFNRLEQFVINHNLKRQGHEECYGILSKLNKPATFLQSLKKFLIKTGNDFNNGGVRPSKLDMSNTFSYVTSLNMITHHSRLYKENIGQFTNLISLKTNLFFQQAYTKPEYCTELFFIGLKGLKALKDLELKVDPSLSDPGIWHIQVFMHNFAIPESVEALTLQMDWFRLFEILPEMDNKTLFIQANNPLENHEFVREFAEKWRTLVNLKNIDLKFSHRANDGYILNRYFAFLIFSRVPKAEKIRYFQAFYGASNTDWSRPPLDFGLFMQSIEHLSPHLTSITLDNGHWGVAVKNNFQISKIDMPRLNEFNVGTQILGQDFFLNLPRMLIENSLKHGENINITLNSLLMQTDQDFRALIDILSTIPKSSSVDVSVNAWYLQPEKMARDLCDFLENAKPEGSVTLSITETQLLSKGENHKIRKRLLTRKVFKEFRITTRHSILPLFDTSRGTYLNYKIVQKKVKWLRITDYWQGIDYL